MDLGYTLCMDIMKWFRTVTQGDSVNAAAKAAGLNQPTLSRQVNAGTLSPESVVAIARAYDADPLEGLIILGLITEDDVKRHGAAVILSDLTDKMLADEVWDRMQEGRVVENAYSKPELVVIEELDPERDAANDVGYDIDEEIEHHLDTP